MIARPARRVRDVTLRIACAQLRARPLREAVAALQDILDAIRAAKRQRADLVVLPECAYPGYVLLARDPYRTGIPSAAVALEKISAAAARHAIHVVVGLARHGRAGLENQAVFIDDCGRELGTYAKSYLWSFDTRWFAPGSKPGVVQTRFGKLGAMICADGRVPEIAQRLARAGAWLIVDPTAWVSYGRSFGEMANPQVQFMLRARAFENGVWIAAADKCGSEHAAVYYVGASQIVSPDGVVVAQAGVTQPELIVAPVRAPRRRKVFAPRQARANALNAVPARSKGSNARRGGLVWLGLYQASRAKSAHEDDALRTLRAQGADVIVRTDASLAMLRAVFRPLRDLRAACIEGRAMAAPECARAAARAGADLLVWLGAPLRFPVLELARTRALESRIYVLVCVPPRADASSCLVNPDGNVVASALGGEASAFIAPLEIAAARRKLVVPGTRVL